MTGPEIGISPKRDFPQVHFKFYLQKIISTHLYFPQRFAGCGRGGRGPGGEAEEHHLREKKIQIRGPFFRFIPNRYHPGKSGLVSLTCFFLYSSIVRNFSCSAWKSLESGKNYFFSFQSLHFPQILYNGKTTNSNNYGIPYYVPSLEYVLLVLLVLQEE